MIENLIIINIRTPDLSQFLVSHFLYPVCHFDKLSAALCGCFFTTKDTKVTQRKFFYEFFVYSLCPPCLSGKIFSPQRRKDAKKNTKNKGFIKQIDSVGAYKTLI
ncbi:MAG: hypothetical protein EA394_07690 [Bacteroidia bacterium]|nr:MAG: hypothetical protein EA394_07690 [Bacteroidia bacterium]